MKPKLLYLALPVTAKTLDSISTTIGMKLGFGERNPLFHTFPVPIAHLLSFALFMSLIGLTYIVRLSFKEQPIFGDTIAVMLTALTFLVVANNMFLILTR